MEPTVINANTFLELKDNTISPSHMHRTVVQAAIIEPIRLINERSHPHMKAILDQDYQIMLIHLRVPRDVSAASMFRPGQTLSVYLVTNTWTIDELREIPQRSSVIIEALIPIYSATRSRKQAIIYAKILTPVN